ncbi:MAG: gliding motility-associated C-terminal domain-containing protein [Bacteroidales bacterium]|nr:gliding motility-associated C-terminal domain-containing protein [Bacteroidales bacterium]
MKTQLYFFVMGLLSAVGTMSVVQAQPVATVKMDTVRGCPGEIVEVPVRIYGVSELGMDAFTFEFNLDTSQAEPVLITWDPVRDQGFPMIADWNEDLLKRGSFVANYYLGNTLSNLAVTWLDGAYGQPNLKFEDGSILFNITVKIKKATGTIDFPIALVAYEAARNINYDVNRVEAPVVQKNTPIVKIDRSELRPTPPRIIHGVVVDSNRNDHSMCVDHTLHLKASGAERYEWGIYEVLANHYYSDHMDTILDNPNVANPIFTPVPRYYRNSSGVIFLGLISSYHLAVTGYDSDGCMAIDSVRLGVSGFSRDLGEQPTHLIVNKGDVIDLQVVFHPADSATMWAWDEPHAGYTYKWFPEEMVEDPSPLYSMTKSKPIHEPIWFFGEALTKGGSQCTRTVNIRVDVRDPDRLYGRLEKNQSLFCGQSGTTEHQVTFATLTEGQSDGKIYTWEYRKFYEGQDPIFFELERDGEGNEIEVLTENPNQSAAHLKFFGTTEVSVRIQDLELGQELILTDTVWVKPIQTMSVQIDMDEASKRQDELGFCSDMPISFLITSIVEIGNNVQIYWERNRSRIRDYDGLMQIHVPKVGHEQTFRAVVYSEAECLTSPYAFSNEIAPISEVPAYTSVWISDFDQPVQCNSDLATLRFYANNIGTDALFQIYRNDEFLDEFTYNGDEGLFIYHQVQSVNYWDRFNVKFTNTSSKCLSNNNSRFSNYYTPNLKTTEHLVVPQVVSDLGGGTICDSPDEIYTFRLKGMEQFGKNTTVIWMLNNQEWMRYEYDVAVSAQLNFNPPKHPDHFVINEETMLERDAFAEQYAFHINADGFPKVGTTFTIADSLWAVVITRAECASGGIADIERRIPGLRPTFTPIQEAVLTVTPNADLSVCKGENLTFSADVQNVNFGTVTWFFNDRKAGEGLTFTAEKILQGDKLVAVLESNYKCATNLPLSSGELIFDVRELPAITVPSKDTVTICNGEEIQLAIETSAISFAWNADATLSSTTVKQPIAKPEPNSIKTYIVTVTDEFGCSATEKMIITTAPEVNITATIALVDPADTIICREKLIAIQSEFSPLISPAHHRWFRNGYPVNNASENMATSTSRDGDVWQFEVTLPTLTTCSPKTVLSNQIAITVKTPAQPEILADEMYVCQGQPVWLTAVGGGHHRWTADNSDFTATGETIEVQPYQTTTYYLHVFESVSPCFSENSITINVSETQPEAKILLITPERDVKARELVRFKNDGSNWTNAVWEFDGEVDHNTAIDVDYTFDTIGTFPVILLVENDFGCVDNDTLWVNVLPTLNGVFVPSAFMPGATNVEDRVLKVYGVDILPNGFKFSVYTMEGREVFTSRNPNNGWDGRFQGRDMPSGNYSYVVVGKFASGEEFTKSGTVVLIR